MLCEQVAANLFAGLRELDLSKEVELILSETVPEEGVGVAVMNRLSKAASHSVLRD